MNRNIIIIILSITIMLLSLRMDLLIDSFRGDRLADLAQILSITGDGIVLTGVCIFLFAIGLLLKKEELSRSGTYGIGVILAAGFIVNLFKIVFERNRPAYSGIDILSHIEMPTLLDFSGRFNSFPSGHTTISFALAYSLSRTYPRLSPVFFAVASMIGFSRIYLGSHYPSDVAGGALLGLGVGAFLFSYSKNHLQTGLFLSLAIFISFFKLGSLLLFDVDEAVFSEATREMIEAGNYITPTYNFEPRYDKPILFYWLMAIGYKLFGIGEFSARLTSSVFGVMLSAMTYFFVKKIDSQRTAIICGLCLILNIEYFVYSHSAVTDMTLAFFIAASLYCFYLGFYKYPDLSGAVSWYLLFWVFAAMASLTKGIIGIFLPAMIVFIYLLVSRELNKLKILLAPRYLIVFSAIAFPWYAAQMLINGWEFYDAFIIKHHFQRYTEVISSHSGPIYFYVLVIMAGFFPWAFFLPNAIYNVLRRKGQAYDTNKQGIYLFGLIWFLVIFIFFSFSSTKLPNYIMPLFPAIAVITGLTISDIFENSFNRKWLIISCGFIMVISSLLAIIFFYFAFTGVEMEIAIQPILLVGLGICFSVMALVSYIMAGGRYPVVSISGMAAATFVMLILLRTYGAPPVNIYLQKTLYQYSVYAEKNLTSEDVLATYNINQPSISFYSKRKVIKLEGDKGLEELASMKDNRRILVITKKENIKILEGKANYALLETDGKYALLAKK